MMKFLNRFNTAGLRRKRYERIARILDLKPTDRILDLGCGPGGRSVAGYSPKNEIVGVDLLAPEEVNVEHPNFRYIKLDASDMHEFEDDSFDVAISVGMLEHVRPYESLRRAAKETQRVARRYCFVVPHKYAFLEPHFYLPLFAIWPGRLKSSLIKRFTLGTQQRQPSGEWQRINWLTRREWRAVFDDPNLVIKNHWYGPLMQYYLIFGGDLGPPRSE